MNDDIGETIFTLAIGIAIKVIFAFIVYYVFKDMHAPEWGRWLAVLVVTWS